MSFDLRLAVPAAVMWIVCAVAVAVADSAWWLAAAVWTVAGVGGILAVVSLVARRGAPRRRPRPRARRRWTVRIGWTAAALSTIGAAAALSSIAADAPRRAPAALSAIARSGATVKLSVRIDTSPNGIRSGFDGAPRWMWRGTALSAADSARSLRLDTPVSLIASLGTDAARKIAFGSTVVVEAALRATEPGEATSYVATARGAPVLVGESPPWLGWTAPLRESLAEAAAHTPGDGGALLPGVSIGDVTAVGSKLDEAMKVSSLSHLTAVSGANCALVTGLVFFGCAYAGLGRRTRVAFALLALAAFVVLVTPGASVIRAAAMAVVVLIALARGRPAQGLPVLSLAVVVLLLHDPWLSRDYGFALSVLATGGLLVLAGPLARLLTRWMPRALAIVVAIPLAAQLMCQPVLVMLAPTLPLYGVMANLLAEPAAPAGTILGLLACLVLPIAPALGNVLVWLAWVPSAWIAQVAHTASSLPASSLPWLDGPFGVILCAAAVVGILILALARRGRGQGILVAVAGGALLAGVGAYSGSLGGGVLGRALSIPADWQIAACDVGQGDGLLVRDGDRVAMIDVGRHPEPAKACVERLGVNHLDFLLLTHYDVDHIGGVSAVESMASTIIIGQTSRPQDERVVAELRATGATITQGFAGMSGMLGSLAWRIVWPPVPPPGVTAVSGNPGSVTIEIEGNGIRSIYLGDLGENAQNQLLATGTIQPVDVVKMAHHGSADQSPAFYERLHATVGLVSVGVNNGYGHPTPRALDILARNGTVAERTDRQGLLLVSPGATPGSVKVWSERDANADAAASAGRSHDSRGPYAGNDRGGTWRHDQAARRARAKGAPRRPPSRSSRGTRSGRHRWFWSRVRKAFWPSVRSVRCATSSRRAIRVSRSATSPPATAHRESC